MKFITFLLAMFTVMSCVNVRVTRHHVGPRLQNPTLMVARYHGDMGFSSSERIRIDNAIRMLNEQAGGVVKVHVDYDLDFSSTWSVTSRVKENMIVRAPVDAPYVKREDTQDGVLFGVVMGVDLKDYDPRDPKRAYLVADRLQQDDLLEHVTMHEILHSVGLKHVDDRNAVMYHRTQRPVPTTCMNEADVKEMCRVLLCNPKTIGWCE